MPQLIQMPLCSIFKTGKLVLLGEEENSIRRVFSGRDSSNLDTSLNRLIGGNFFVTATEAGHFISRLNEPFRSVGRDGKYLVNL